jgi:hypothetical protein
MKEDRLACRHLMPSTDFPIVQSSQALSVAQVTRILLSSVVSFSLIVWMSKLLVRECFYFQTFLPQCL